MNRRNGIIAIICGWAAYVLPKKAKGQDTTNYSFMVSTKPPTLQLNLDQYGADDIVIRVEFGSQTVELKAAEIIEALSNEQSRPVEKAK
jgi:hypothetical protein